MISQFITLLLFAFISVNLPQSQAQTTDTDPCREINFDLHTLNRCPYDQNDRRIFEFLIQLPVGCNFGNINIRYNNGAGAKKLNEVCQTELKGFTESKFDKIKGVVETPNEAIVICSGKHPD